MTHEQNPVLDLGTKIERALGKARAMIADPGGEAWPEHLRLTGVSSSEDFFATGDNPGAVEKVATVTDRLKNETLPALWEKAGQHGISPEDVTADEGAMEGPPGEFSAEVLEKIQKMLGEQRRGLIASGSIELGVDKPRAVVIYEADDEAVPARPKEFYAIEDVATAVDPNKCMWIGDINEWVQIISGGMPEVVVKQNDGTVSFREKDFRQIVDAVRLFTKQELTSDLTLRILSPFATQYAPDVAEGISRSLSSQRPVELRISPRYRDIILDCLPSGRDYKFVKELIKSDVGERIFTKTIVETLERLGERAEVLFRGLTTNSIWRVVDNQWWEVMEAPEMYTSAQWHIMARCALLQRKGISTGNVVNTICSYFWIPIPDRYKDHAGLLYKQNRPPRLPKFPGGI